MGFMPVGCFKRTPDDPLGWIDPNGSVHCGEPVVALETYKSTLTLERSRENGNKEKACKEGS